MGSIIVVMKKQKFSKISVEEMRSIASLTAYGIARNMKDEIVTSEFGGTPEILVTLWKLIYNHLPPYSQPHHMLWWLYLCKHYSTKAVFEKALRVSAPTARKYMKPIKIACLRIRNKVVSGLG